MGLSGAVFRVLKSDANNILVYGVYLIDFTIPGFIVFKELDLTFRFCLAADDC